MQYAMRWPRLRPWALSARVLGFLVCFRFAVPLSGAHHYGNLRSTKTLPNNNKGKTTTTRTSKQTLSWKSLIQLSQKVLARGSQSNTAYGLRVLAFGMRLRVWGLGLSMAWEYFVAW